MNRFVQLMAAPAAFVQIALVSFVTGLVTYFSESSLWPALKYGGACYLLMQLGYFLGVLCLVYHESRDGREHRRKLGASTTPSVPKSRAYPRTAKARSL